jgi:transcriptional regulator with XRE-family HTH domain
MLAGMIELDGKRFVVIPEEEYDRLRQCAAVAGDVDLPALPAPDDKGNCPAVTALRVGLARRLIRRRWAVGLSQAEVARRAGIRPETLNRIEKAKVTADTETIAAVVRALEAAERLDAARGGTRLAEAAPRSSSRPAGRPRGAKSASPEASPRAEVPRRPPAAPRPRRRRR